MLAQLPAELKIVILNFSARNSLSDLLSLRATNRSFHALYLANAAPLLESALTFGLGASPLSRIHALAVTLHTSEKSDTLHPQTLSDLLNQLRENTARYDRETLLEAIRNFRIIQDRAQELLNSPERRQDYVGGPATLEVWTQALFLHLFRYLAGRLDLEEVGLEDNPSVVGAVLDLKNLSTNTFWKADDFAASDIWSAGEEVEYTFVSIMRFSVIQMVGLDPAYARASVNTMFEDGNRVLTFGDGERSERVRINMDKFSRQARMYFYGKDFDRFFDWRDVFRLMKGKLNMKLESAQRVGAKRTVEYPAEELRRLFWKELEGMKKDGMVLPVEEDAA